MEQLLAALDRAGCGYGQVVAVVGEPGVGKSRLVWEITHSHRALGWRILRAGSVSYGRATPYLPLIDLLKGYFKIQDRDEVHEIREKVTCKTIDGVPGGLELAVLSIPYKYGSRPPKAKCLHYSATSGCASEAAGIHCSPWRHRDVPTSITCSAALDAGNRISIVRQSRVHVSRLADLTPGVTLICLEVRGEGNEKA